MPLVIENLHVTVRVTTASRGSTDDLAQRRDRGQASPRVHMMRPPRAHAGSGEMQAQLQAEQAPEHAAASASDVNPKDLAERVYELMRYDIRVARERGGQPR
jgi:hypothetical protein